MVTRRRRKPAKLGSDMNLTPLIDIVFQLLIFFVMTAVFLQVEGMLSLPLPKDHGIEDSLPQPILDEVTIYLDWIGAPDTGHCVAKTARYETSEGNLEAIHEFRSITPGKGPGFEPNKHVTYVYPDFNEITDFLVVRSAGGRELGYDLPVTIHFEDTVPVQMVVNMVDVCKKAGIKNCGINAQ